MDWAGCLHSAHPGCAAAASCIPASSAASQDFQQHPRIQGCSAALQATHRKNHLGTCAPGAFGFFPQWQWGSDTWAVFYPQARFGKGFSRPFAQNLLCHSWIHPNFLLHGGGGALHQGFPGQESASPSRLANPRPAQFPSHWNID